MSITDDMAFGKATVYDDEGRTKIPKDVLDRMGWNRGTKLKFVVINGELRVVENSE